MIDDAARRAAEPFLAALTSCTNHLSGLEVFEVCARGGEGELNDLLRHAVNRLVRPDQIVQREQTRPGVISRADLALSDTGSGMLWAVVEAKMVYAWDAIDAHGLWVPKIGRDLGKLSRIPTPGPPGFLLTWMPHFPSVRRPLRYMRGHQASTDGFTARTSIEDARESMEAWLDAHGTRAPRVCVRDATSVDGHVVLDAYLTAIAR